MAFRLAYLMLVRTLSWLALLARSDAAKDIEILGRMMAGRIGRVVPGSAQGPECCSCAASTT